jgi:hypothetical protein
MNTAAMRALARAADDAANAFAQLARAARDEASGDDDWIPETEAAKLAGVSIRTLRADRRAGRIKVYGKQRSRVVRRRDLEAYIESRRVPLVRDVIKADDVDVERRVRRLERGA